MYSDFALLYDELMEDVDYAGWADYYASLLEDAGIPPGSLVTECACGTGSLTLALSRRYEMCGVDISQEMLSIAALKLRSGGKRVPLIRQDMRKLRLHRQQDAILCTCDGVNYLTDEAALRGFFASARAALRPGGALCFDVSSLHKLSEVLGDHTLTNTQGRVHYIWENHWDPVRRLLDMRLQLYARERDNCFRHTEEIQRQRAWTEDELAGMLEACGFERSLIYGDRTRRQPGEGEKRLHLLARKP